MATSMEMDTSTAAATVATSDDTAFSGDPPTSPTTTTTASEAEPSASTRPSMGPPPPKNPNNPNSDTEQSDSLTSENSELTSHSTAIEEHPFPPPSDSPSSSNDKERLQSQSMAVPYTIPQWSQPPSLPFSLEVLKDGSIIDQLDVTKKGAYMFGRIDLCDFVLEHPTISRFHAVLQFKSNGDAYLYDLGSTHGSFINKNEVKKKVYVQLRVGDVIRFGHSSRLYIFQGPEELMPPEADVTSITYAKDREASLRRARENAAVADGISWGMREDAIEEAEDDPEEITWQNYKGELTERQEKTREKVLKRLEKIAHMKKEIAAIRAKDIAQGGLTQGQQTQIARNEMRIAQIMEELESLEETLNDSIRESIGARAGKSSRHRQKGTAEDEDEILSDDDEFYDRTKKKSVNKTADAQSVETADSLLDKKEVLMREMEEKKRKLFEEKNKMSEPTVEPDAGDALDAFMSGLSSQLVLDRTAQLEKDLSSLQSELDRIVYLLKIADPTGEAAKIRETSAQLPKPIKSPSSSSTVKRPEKTKIEPKKVSQPEKPVLHSVTKEATPEVVEEGNSEAPKSNASVTETTESEHTVYSVAKLQWLGAVKERESKESQPENNQSDSNTEADEFVDYKDRKKILESNTPQNQEMNVESDLESAAPGLILRKKKPVERAKTSEDGESRAPESAGAMLAQDAVALLLKHKRGLYATDEEEAGLEGHDRRDEKQSGQKDNKRPKRVLGPEKPAFLKTHSEDYETWVPPEGQSGDGRTSLNDRLGY